jgi:Na+-transporting methylmalonyl-CoA/oxaloacetate decarboxylase gamma subunit
VITLAASNASSNAAPGTLGFLVVFGMAVILFFVFRSMSKHLRRVNAAARQDAEAAAKDGTAVSAAAQDSAADGTTASPQAQDLRPRS